MKRTFSLLLAFLMLFSAVPAGAVVAGVPQTTPKPSSGTSASGTNASGFTIKPIDWDTAVMGQYALPDGYTAVRVINNCEDHVTTLGHPIRVSVILSGKKDQSTMIYYYGEDYVELVGRKHQDGKIDQQTMSIMRRYVNADDYCEALALKWAPDAVFYKNEDMSSADARLKAMYNEMTTVWAQGLKEKRFKMDWAETTAAQRVYTYKKGDETFCISVMAEVWAYQQSGGGKTTIVWMVPCYYILMCPLKDYERIHGNAFAVFTENTSVNDEMIALNDRLTEEIAAEVIRKWNMQCAASSAYMATMTALTFSMVESQWGSHVYTGSYSSDRFSDYMFDQNDYTLSDGSSVKVPTSYNYVWEGSNGTVYYGSSLSDAPGGGTRLYANR